MDVRQIIDAIHGPGKDGKKKTAIGLVYEMWGEDGSEELNDRLIMSKPIVNVSRFPAENNDIFYCFEFEFRSNKDEDYKKLWLFLERFAKDSFNVKEEDTKVPGLTISIVPDAFRGEYFVLASIPLVDLIEKIEHAGQKPASIRLYFEETNVQFLQNDPDTFNTRILQEEILRERERGNFSEAADETEVNADQVEE